MSDRAESVEEFLARGGGIYEAKHGETGETKDCKPYINKPEGGYPLPNSGFHHITEKRMVDGTLKYTVIVRRQNYGTLPSLDLAVIRRNKIWKKLGITEADFL